MSVSCSAPIQGFGWEVEPDRDRVWVRLRGELDLAGAPGLRHALDELRACGWEHVGLDLRQLTFIDVAGMRVLFEESSHARLRRGTLTIIPSPCYQRLLGLCAITDLSVKPRPPARPRSTSSPPARAVRR